MVSNNQPDSEATYRVAPPGFTREQWEAFDRDGIIRIEDAIDPAAIAEYLEAYERVLEDNEHFHNGETVGLENIVELDPTFAALIDHERHVGFAYDVFGELLKLHQSQLFFRPPGGGRNNIWHPDGARAVPYGVFSDRLPLCMKIGYWLTDLPEANMGNFCYIPGSHRTQYQESYDTHEEAEGMEVLRCRAGTMTVMNSSLWHMVQPNHSKVVRKNLFIAYCPSWVTPADRFHSDPEWLQTLNREQRIIMRSYGHAYANAKPPASEFPLFLDRESQGERDPGRYRDHVVLNRRKRITQAERFLGAV